MKQRRGLTWSVGLGMSLMVLCSLRPAPGFDFRWDAVVVLAGLTTASGVVPALGLATRWFAGRGGPARGWFGVAALALFLPVGISVGVSLLLMGLPHGSYTALSPVDFARRTLYITASVTPSTLATFAVVRLWDPVWKPSP
ncbi:hypothetical protein ACODT5_05480 [Streptomyces sp. 5.8]|uniref:hypothetical protein n=1 Tax=Streptomyces sp. 5.8 TaxID=3406571 RepID=UPI003BB72A27